MASLNMIPEVPSCGYQLHFHIWGKDWFQLQKDLMHSSNEIAVYVLGVVYFIRPLMYGTRNVLHQFSSLLSYTEIIVYP